MIPTIIETPKASQTPSQASTPKTREKWIALATISVPLVAISALAIVAMTYTGGGWFGAVSAWFTSGPSFSAPLFGHQAANILMYGWIGLALTVAIAAPLIALKREKTVEEPVEKTVEAPVEKEVQPLFYAPEPGQEAINLDRIKRVLTLREKRRMHGFLPIA